jgi:biopolymer transport protein ExbB
MARASDRDDYEITGINVTPLVDIMLVLLVIFMVTATYIVKEAILVELPRAAAAGETPAETLLLVVTKDGKTYLDGVPLDDIVRGRLRYERFLSLLGTLGNNAPFIGLFGTVLGIVDAFAALASNAQRGAMTSGAANIMGGISEALVATAVGLMVALPAVAVHNVFGRWLKTIVARSECIGHALASHLKSLPVDPAR